MSKPENERNSSSVESSDKVIEDAGQSAAVEKPSHPDNPRNTGKTEDTDATVLQRRKSSGPRTRQGKARASRNSLKYGFLSKMVVIHSPKISEDPEDYKRLLNWYVKDRRPIGPLEFHQIEIAVTAYWQYGRIIRTDYVSHDEKVFKSKDEEAEAEFVQMLNSQDLAMSVKATENEGDVPQWIGRETEIDTRDFEELSRQQKIAVDKYSRTHEVINKVCAFLEQKVEPKARENAMRYASHLLRTYYRALSELERLQRMRCGGHVPAPIVVSLDDNGNT